MSAKSLSVLLFIGVQVIFFLRQRIMTHYDRAVLEFLLDVARMSVKSFTDKEGSRSNEKWLHVLPGFRVK